MKHGFAILAAALATMSAAPPPAALPAPTVVAELTGRTPGKAQRCMSGTPGILFTTSGSDPQLLLFDDGKTIWASNLGPSCGYGPSESVVPDASASYYCKGDFVRAGGRNVIIPGRRCTLGDFTPWRAAK